MMDNRDWFYLVVGLGIAFLIAYFFLWGKPYSKLENEHKNLQSSFNSLQAKHIKLNHTYIQLQNNYTKLQANYTNLQNACGEVLKKYEACVNKDTFFDFLNKFLALRELAKLLLLI